MEIYLHQMIDWYVTKFRDSNLFNTDNSDQCICILVKVSSLIKQCINLDFLMIRQILSLCANIVSLH